MNAIAPRAANAAGRFIPPWVLRALSRPPAERLKRLLRDALEDVNAATPDVAAEFYRFPFP